MKKRKGMKNKCFILWLFVFGFTKKEKGDKKEKIKREKQDWIRNINIKRFNIKKRKRKKKKKNNEEKHTHKQKNNLSIPPLSSRKFVR